jgi:threonine synthase
VRSLTCVNCGREHDAREFRYFCADCRGFLDVTFDTDRIRESLARDDIDSRPPSIMHRWLEFLPIEDPLLIDRVTLGESVTPLVRAGRVARKLGLRNLYFKDESRFPTGSLKDRSMPLVVLKALEFGFGSVSIVSSGNAAASLSAYAARTGLRAVVFVAGGHSARLAKIRSYRPTLVQVNAPYSEAESLYLRAREEYGWYDCNGLINPFRLEGKKTLAHEICHALGWTVPDIVILPTAFGNGLVSAWRGFMELETIGWTSGKPAMFAAQPENCAPIARAWERGAANVEPVKALPTVAHSIAVGDPAIGGGRVLKVARESGGGVTALPEEMILEAQALLAGEEGLFVEPAGATGLATVMKMLAESSIERDALIVASITGEGLSDPGVVDRWAPGAQMIEPDMQSLKRALGRVSEE